MADERDYSDIHLREDVTATKTALEQHLNSCAEQNRKVQGHFDTLYKKVHGLQVEVTAEFGKLRYQILVAVLAVLASITAFLFVQWLKAKGLF